MPLAIFSSFSTDTERTQHSHVLVLVYRTCTYSLHACMYCTLLQTGLGGFPVGQKSVRFFPSEMYRQVKLRLRKIPLGQFPFGFIAGGVFSGRISGGILVHTCKQTQAMRFKSDK